MKNTTVVPVGIDVARTSSTSCGGEAPVERFANDLEGHDRLAQR